jgi:hypothetical protein
MNLCNNNHQEVCFEGRECPLCQSVKELQQEIDALLEERDHLKEQLEQEA